ncbi:MAG: fatty acid CoA ligase family protein [Planctomycetia bacterium]|nr:fatty acid CoA ligase family protein [Planctomycetia bacterium]
MKNVAYHLRRFAESQPGQIAVVEPRGYKNGKRQYKTMSFRELDEDSDRIAHGLHEMGVRRGTRIALLVRPGVDFVSSVFGCLKSGAVMILIDPGMGKRNLISCLEEARPQGFLAISAVQALWRFMRLRFPEAEYHLTVGRRWFWGGPTLAGLRKKPYPGAFMEEVSEEDPAAIIFTTGSTGPPKGVLYEHKTFNAQVQQIAQEYGIQAGQTDLPGFPMFGLFNCAMGSTAVIPDMDASRPASVNPKNILEAARDWNVTQSFGSPTIWKVVSRWCLENHTRLEQIKMILSAGAPVQEPVLRSVKAIIHPEGEIHTPYGATEALPVATISASEVLAETAEKSRHGAGVCVGRKFSGIQWKVIQITDEAIPELSEVQELPEGEIGELIVSGPQVTREYVTRVEVNALAKIYDPQTGAVWHRMGDVGYLDAQQRFWFCGRKAHRVQAEAKTFFSIPVEAIFNEHPSVVRSALVGVKKEVDGKTKMVPVIIIEPKDPQVCRDAKKREKLRKELMEVGGQNDLTRDVNVILFHPSFPVDIRHNAKIFREKLADWAAKEI